MLETIRASGADVSGSRRPSTPHAGIARALGWYASERTQVISRYRLIDPPGGDGLYVYVELGPGQRRCDRQRAPALDPVRPYRVRDGATPEELDELERSTRLPAIQEQLAVLPGLVAAGHSRSS